MPRHCFILLALVLTATLCARPSFDPPPPRRKGDHRCPIGLTGSGDAIAELVNGALQLQNEARAVDAEACFIEALRRNPNFAITYNNLASLYGGLGRHKEAEELLTKGIALDPSMYQSWYNRGNQRTALGDYRGAKADLLEATRLHKDPTLYNALAIACYYLKEHKEIIKYKFL